MYSGNIFWNMKVPVIAFYGISNLSSVHTPPERGKLCVALTPSTVPGTWQSLETHILIKCREFLESRA